jgi:predicted XRE-type DNA-binding protein
MGKIKFPSNSELKRMRDKLSKGPASLLLPKNASPADKIKYQICKEFVVFKNANQITQKTLAEKINIDEAIMSKILHYNIEKFTIDRLLKYLVILRPDAELKIEVA